MLSLLSITMTIERLVRTETVEVMKRGWFSNDEIPVTAETSYAVESGEVVFWSPSVETTPATATPMSSATAVLGGLLYKGQADSSLQHMAKIQEQQHSGAFKEPTRVPREYQRTDASCSIM